MENNIEIVHELMNKGIRVINGNPNRTLIDMFNKLPDTIDNTTFYKYYKLVAIAKKYNLECLTEIAQNLTNREVLNQDLKIETIRELLEGIANCKENFELILETNFNKLPEIIDEATFDKFLIYVTFAIDFNLESAEYMASTLSEKNILNQSDELQYRKFYLAGLVNGLEQNKKQK